jgi:hypothetical protein
MAIAWPDGVNQKILRSTKWELPLGLISDMTRSGKSKRRAALTLTPVSFNVTMNMTLDEYRIFENWYNNTCRRGVFSFLFPKINDNTDDLAEYRIVSALEISNISGDILEISMGWEQC